MMLQGSFFMREVNLVNDNERTLLRYVVEGDIRKSQQQAKIVLEGLTTVKDKAFKETGLRTLANKSPTLIELPYNLQGLLVAEDSSTFREDRFLIRDDEKAVIVKMCKTRRAALRLQEMGIHYTSSLLLMGEPGTGKTELARYIAYTTNLPFVYTNFSGMVNSALGKTQKNIGMVFDYARKSPCVLCLDEIDAIGTRRGGKDDVAEMNRVTIALMQELDRLGNDIILVGTTNRPDTLDDALLRRFTFGHTVRPLCRDDARTLARMFFASVGYSASDAEIESLLDDTSQYYTASKITNLCMHYLNFALCSDTVFVHDERRPFGRAAENKEQRSNYMQYYGTGFCVNAEQMRRSDVIDHRMHRVGNKSLRFSERIEPGKVFEHFVNHTCI